jgi:hypothetical protein
VPSRCGSEDAFRSDLEDAAKSGMNEAVQVLREHPGTAVLRAIG